MGIKERQERDREAIRRGILDAARELFVKEGYEHVSIRKIAERIEYSPAAIYGYFPSKDDIFFALAEEGFRLLGDPAGEPHRERLAGLSPLERVRAIFWRMYEFSRDHPQYFELMFVDRSVPRISREYERFAFARETKRRLIAEIERCVAEEQLPATVNAGVAMRLLTVGLVGVAVLSRSERFGPEVSVDAIAGDVLDATLAGLKAGVMLRSTADSISCPGDESIADAQAS